MDSRVRWSHNTAAMIRSENSGRLKTIERNRRFYDGEQWNSNRPPWKNAAVLNYCSFVCDHWAALLSDNKPRFVYEALRREDEYQAEIASACRDYDELRDDWQEKREMAILASRVEQVSYYTLRYDPSKYSYQGGITLKVVSSTQIFLDKNATCIDDAEYVLYEYYESEGALLSKYKKLRDVIERDWRAQNDGFDENNNEMVGVPAQFVESTASSPTYEPPRQAPAAARNGGDGSRGHRVREWWLRPKGPRNSIKVKKLKWRPDGTIATKRKFLEFSNGELEPLMTVVTEGNIVYELPMSVAMIMEFVGDTLGGPKVLFMNDTLEPVFEMVEVPLYPSGRRMVIVGDYVADDGANPFNHGEFPFVELRALASFSGKKVCGDIDRFWQLQEYLNRLVALIMDCAQLTSNPITIMPIDTQIGDEDLTNAPGAIVRVDSIGAKLMKRLEGPALPAYVMQLVQLIISQIREISGLTEVATGGKFKGQQSAETVSMYQDSAGVIFRQGIRHVEQAETRLGRQYLGLVRQFYQDSRMIKVKSAMGIPKEIQFRGSELDADLLMKTKSGSQLPSSPSARLTAVMGLYAQGLVDIPEVLKYLQENGQIESADALMARLEYYVKHPQDLWKNPVFKQQLEGNSKKQGGKSNNKNAGRSSRSTTPHKAMAA